MGPSFHFMRKPTQGGTFLSCKRRRFGKFPPRWVLAFMTPPQPEQNATIVAILRNRHTYLTTVEVMAILNRSRTLLCAMVREGRIPAHRDGNCYLFDPLELADWLEARRTQRRAA